VDVVSALAGSKDGYSSMSGTSMAVPLVSGATAILLQAQPDLKPADVKRMLLKTADDLGPSGPDNVYGYGALNLTNALESVETAPAKLSAPALESMQLSRDDIMAINSNIIGPDRTLEIPMEDFDANGIFSARWETSFWTPGDYKVRVDLQGRFGEVDSKAVPFRLAERR
jgi:serine protease AprX